jgi:AcrR family transcriptional regulator
MPLASPSSEGGVKRRPKDRKAQIAQASADAFSAQGFHAVSMEDIAARVGVSPAALYRHSQSKYDLFRDAVLTLGQLLVDATAFADDFGPTEDPADMLTQVTEALIAVTTANRTAGGLYRWEARNLRDADRIALHEQISLANRRIQRPLKMLRPRLHTPQRFVLSSATLSVIGSIADHSSALAVDEVRTHMAHVVSSVLAADVPLHRRPAPPSQPRVTESAGTYEFVLNESMLMFHRNGYRVTSIEDIAAAVGIQPSGIYRYFRSKADILVASCRRAADRQSGDLAQITPAPTDAETALADLIAAHVARHFGNPALLHLLYTEGRNLPEAEFDVVDRVQQSTVEAWSSLVNRIRPEVSLARARYSVYAAFGLPISMGQRDDAGDVGGSVSQATILSQDTLSRLMETVLLGRPARPSRNRPLRR